MTAPTRGNGADHAEQGFEFPGRFEITAVGDAAAGLAERVPQMLESVGLVVLRETVRQRHSREGNYVSVTVSFDCPTRAKYEAAHTVLRADPAVRYTL